MLLLPQVRRLVNDACAPVVEVYFVNLIELIRQPARPLDDEADVAHARQHIADIGSLIIDQLVVVAHEPLADVSARLLIPVPACHQARSQEA